MTSSTKNRNALAIAAKRARDICDRIISDQEEQGIKKRLPDIVETLWAIEGLNYWSLAVISASRNSQHALLKDANSAFLRSLEFCKPQVEKFGSVEKLLNYAESLISVQKRLNL